MEIGDRPSSEEHAPDDLVEYVRQSVNCKADAGMPLSISEWTATNKETYV